MNARSDLVGKYQRLLRELMERDAGGLHGAMHRRRLERDVMRIGAELETAMPEAARFLETMPWSEPVGTTVAVTPERPLDRPRPPDDE